MQATPPSDDADLDADLDAYSPSFAACALGLTSALLAVLVFAVWLTAGG